MLPIETVLPALVDALARRGVAVLQAPPGAGKTTRVPLALLDAGWLAGRSIVMLEPRRLAARAAARHMARLLGEPVGETVGYRVRRDTCVGPRTRIEVVTEGVLTRMLQSDPALEHVGIVIFDEFHERSLHADLGLALTLQTRELLRDDLRLLVMSATLDGGAVAALIGHGAAAPMVTSHGRAFPVETRYVPGRTPQRLDAHVVSVVRQALAADAGDILVFLPGAGEITRVERMLLDEPLPARTTVAPLHGSLAQAAQDRAIAPSRPGERRIVLATTVAQTSITIEGVRIVIDCGLVRVPRFAPRTGMTRLETVRVSRASADQRRGRAGRTEPGICYRLWDARDDAGLIAFDQPEILEADLASLALELAAAGIGDAGTLRWIDAPPRAALAQARELLAQLGALGADGRITAHGRAIASLGAHPRIAHMLLRAADQGRGAASVACDLAALIGQRDLLRFARTDGAGPDVDIRLRLEVMRSARAGASRDDVHGAAVDHGALRHALDESAQWRRTLGVQPAAPAEDDIDAAGLLVAFAYPDRVAQRRVGGATGVTRYLLRNGAGAELPGAQSLGDAPYIAIAELGGVAAQPRIYSAAPLGAAELEEVLRDSVQGEQVLEWDSARAFVQARERTRVGAIVLREGPLRHADPDSVVAALLAGIRRDGLQVLPWSDAAVALRERLAFAHAVDASWPDVSDAALAATLESWLAPSVRGVPGRAAVDAIDMVAALQSQLAWPQRQALDRFAPTHVEVPSGSRIRIDYSAATPVLAVRLQEVFGLHETPRIANGQVPLTVHLLSPAQRPVQVTRDLAGFWRSGYFEVKKELKGRYPRHYWPDDPLVAEPRRGIRR